MNKQRKRIWIISGVGVCLVGGLLMATRPTLADRLVTNRWFIFAYTTISLDMNNNTLTAADRLFSADGRQAKQAVAQVTFKRDHTGRVRVKRRTTRFTWRLDKNVVTLKFRGRHPQTARWTLARTSGKVVGQHFKGYTVDSDEVTGQFFVGKAFLIHKR